MRTSFLRSSSPRRRKKIAAKEQKLALMPISGTPLTPPPPRPTLSGGCLTAGAAGKTKKKTGGARLWMTFHLTGATEVVECDKSTIIKRASVPARDLRILGPIFSQSSSILARERAIIVNLEFIKAIVTAEEVLLLDPLCPEVLPFVDRLKHHFPSTGTQDIDLLRSSTLQALLDAEGIEGLQNELPFEFQVLEIALEIVCSYIDNSVVALEAEAWPVLDELTKNVSTDNLEYVRSLKSNLTCLLARVQKVRDEIEHLLDDNEDMSQLYLTRKQIQNQQSEALLGSSANSIVPSASKLQRLTSTRSSSLLTNGSDDDVDDLEMLLEAYFMQLEGMRNKILSVREYIDDTEDYVNIQMDNKRNELIQLQLTITMATFAICFETLIAGCFGMNIPCQWYDEDIVGTGMFWNFVFIITVICFGLFLLVFGYARWKKLLGS